MIMSHQVYVKMNNQNTRKKKKFPLTPLHFSPSEVTTGVGLQRHMKISESSLIVERKLQKGISKGQRYESIRQRNTRLMEWRGINVNNIT